MITRAQKIRLGIFVTLSFAFLTGLIIVMVGSRLGVEKDSYRVRFEETVSGLEVGAPVKYHGVRIGSVETIEINRDEVSVVVVTISLKADTPVKADNLVVLNTMGITGLKFLELTGGTNESAFLDSGDEIPSGPSLLDRLTGKADVISEKVELLMNNLIEMTGPEQRRKYDAILDDLATTIEAAQTMVASNESRIEQVVEDLAVAAADLRATAENARKLSSELDGQLGGVIEKLEVLVTDGHAIIRESGERVDVLLVNVDGAVTDLRSLVSSSSVRRIPGQVEETVAAARKLVEETDRNLQGLLSGAKAVAASLEGRITDPRIDQMLESLAVLSVNLDAFVRTLDLTMRQSREDLFKTLGNLKDVVRNLNDFTQMLLESPSILLRGSQLKERDQ